MEMRNLIGEFAIAGFVTVFVCLGCSACKKSSLILVNTEENIKDIKVYVRNRSLYEGRIDPHSCLRIKIDGYPEGGVTYEVDGSAYPGPYVSSSWVDPDYVFVFGSTNEWFRLPFE